MGLSISGLTELFSDPPAVLRTFQARISALYPDYTICHMPGEGIHGEEEGSEDEGEEGWSWAPFVANAVTSHGQYDWHIDMDPGQIDPCSPFSAAHGSYVNREPGRPLFVSMLIYPQVFLRLSVRPHEFHVWPLVTSTTRLTLTNLTSTAITPTSLQLPLPLSFRSPNWIRRGTPRRWSSTRRPTWVSSSARALTAWF